MPVEQVHTYCAMCISRCGVIATVEDGRFTKVNADPEHPNGCICVKGTAAPEMVYAPERLQYPLKRTRPKGDPDPGWTRISWDEALSLATSRLLDIKAQHGAESVVFSRATPAGNATADIDAWVTRLANAFGSPNILTTTHICTWTRGWGAKYTYGAFTPTPDYDHTRCMLLWGVNPHASAPATAMRITQARKRGAKLIVIDPRQHTLAQKADCWLRIRPGYDDVLALGMIHVLFEEKLYAEGFVREWTNGPFLIREDTQQFLTPQDLAASEAPGGFVAWDGRRDRAAHYRPESGYAEDEAEPALTGAFTVRLVSGADVRCRPAMALLQERAAQYAPERSAHLTWVAAKDVRQAVRLFATGQPSCYATWVGLEQHSNAMQTNRVVQCFYALTGQFDQRGSNAFFAGAPARPVGGGNLLPKTQAERRLGLAEHPLGPPNDPGIVQAAEVYQAVLTGDPYPVKAMVCFGSDPLLGHGDGRRGKLALEAVDFYAHIDMAANPSAAFADLLLPACTAWECDMPKASFGGAEDTAFWSQFKRAVVQPLYESRPDLEILFDLAQRLGLGEHFFDGDVEAAWNFQLEPSGLSVEQLRAHPVGVKFEAQPRFRKYAQIDAASGQPRGFGTPSRKIELYSARFAAAGYDPLPAAKATGSPEGEAGDYPLTLTSFRLVQFVDQQHRHIPRLRRQVREPFMEVHPDTAAASDIQDGEWAVLETVMGSIRLQVKYNASLHLQVVAAPYGWWQGCPELGLEGYDPLGPGGANVNLIIPNDDIDPISGSVPHRAQRCRVRKEGVAV